MLRYRGSVHLEGVFIWGVISSNQIKTSSGFRKYLHGAVLSLDTSTNISTKYLRRLRFDRRGQCSAQDSCSTFYVQCTLPRDCTGPRPSPGKVALPRISWDEHAMNTSTSSRRRWNGQYADTLWFDTFASASAIDAVLTVSSNCRQPTFRMVRFHDL